MVQETAKLAIQSGGKILILGDFSYNEVDWIFLYPLEGENTELQVPRMWSTD